MRCAHTNAIDTLYSSLVNMQNLVYISLNYESTEALRTDQRESH